jgi:hypothetical protein
MWLPKLKTHLLKRKKMNKRIEDLTVIEIKAILFDLQNLIAKHQAEGEMLLKILQ